MLRSLMVNTIAFAILLIGWHVLYLSVHEPMIFPDSWSISAALYDLIQTKKFWASFYYTMRTLVLGYLLGMCITAIIVIICLKLPWAKILFIRYSSYFNPLPSFVLLPFMSLFMGLGAAVIYSIIVWNVVWQCGLQLLYAIENVNRRWHKHVVNLQWGSIKALRLVYFPAAISNIISIASISWAQSWRVLISLEVVFGSIGGYFGLGSFIMDTKSKLDVDQMYAVLFVIAVTGVAINSLLNFLAKRWSY